MGDLARIKASEPSDEIVAALTEDGAVIVEGLLDSDLLDRFNAEVDPLVDAAVDDERNFLNPAVEWFMGPTTLSIAGIAAKSDVFSREILIHPLYLAVSDAVLLPNCATYQLNIAHILDRGPGSEQQFMHRDELVWAHLPKPHAEVQLASVIALGEFTADNGATRVVPGSHRWDEDRYPTEAELVPAVMPAGSAVIYLGKTFHGGGPNVTTDMRRRGMHVSFCAGWLRTEENQYLTTPIDKVRAMPPRAQQLLGYQAHDALPIGGGYLGTVELQDPVELMANGKL